MYDASLEATQAPLGRYFQIPEFTVPVLFESPVLAFGASTTDLQTPRKLAYWARQLIASQGAVSGLIQFSSKRIYLEQIQMFRFELFANSYQIRIVIPWWIRSVDISIWEYIGAIDEEYDLIQQQLARIESKIDEL